MSSHRRIEYRSQILIKKIDPSMRLLFIHTFVVGLPSHLALFISTSSPGFAHTPVRSTGNPYTSDPYPSSANHPAARPFVVSKLPYRHFPLHIDISLERSLVIDAEGKNAMLIRKFECGAEDGTVWGMGW